LGSKHFAIKITTNRSVLGTRGGAVDSGTALQTWRWRVKNFSLTQFLTEMSIRNFS